VSRRNRKRELSIARALASFGPVEEATLCAFLEEMERGRQQGMISGWRVTCDFGGCQLEVMFPDRSQQLSARAATFRAAAKQIGEQMIAAVMRGAPEA
jgi:hypothetical protein